METTRYGLRLDVDVPYDQAVAQVTDSLRQEGFGVLTTIDVQGTLRQKLNREFRKYVILGACNPVLADRALHTELRSDCSSRAMSLCTSVRLGSRRLRQWRQGRP